jgi:hypothetical protein
VTAAPIAEVVISLDLDFLGPVRSQQDVGLKVIVRPENGTAVAPPDSGEVCV